MPKSARGRRARKPRAGPASPKPAPVKRTGFHIPAPQFWLLTTLIFALLILRRPDCVTNPQFWAEDATVFFRSELLSGFLKSVVTPYNGYVCVTQRIVAALVSSVPVYYVPLAYAILGSAIDAICCALFILPRFRHIIASDWIRAAVCILVAIVPPANELIGTVVNTQWYVLLAGTLLVFRGDPAERERHPWAAAAGWALLGLLLPFTNPVLILCAPFCLWNTVRRWSYERAYEIGMLAGLGVQLWLFSISKQNPADLGHGVQLGPLAGAVFAAFVYRAVLSLVMGYKLSIAAAAAHSVAVPWTAIAGVALLLALVLWKADWPRRWAVVIVLYIGAASLAITLGGRNIFSMFAQLYDFHGLQFERYLFLAGCSFIFLMGIAADVLLARWNAAAAAGLLALVFCAGAASNYEIPAFPDKHWRDSARVIQQRVDQHQIGAGYPRIAAPIHPDQWVLYLD